jgi:Helix-turn-helix domain
MKRTTLLQDRRMEKFEELLKRWHDGELSGAEAGEFLGCSERQFRRYRRRYEEDGLEGLVDQRLGKASARRIAVDEVMWMLDQYESHYTASEPLGHCPMPFDVFENDRKLRIVLTGPQPSLVNKNLAGKRLRRLRPAGAYYDPVGHAVAGNFGDLLFRHSPLQSAQD